MYAFYKMSAIFEFELFLDIYETRHIFAWLEQNNSLLGSIDFCKPIYGWHI